MSENTELHASAASLHGRGRSGEAERLYRRLLVQAPQAADQEYDEWLRGLIEAYRALGRMREAGHVLVYLHRFGEAHGAFLAEGARVDAARTRDLYARSMPSDPVLAAAGAPGAQAGRKGPSEQVGAARAPRQSLHTGQAQASGQAQALHLAAARDYAEAGLPAHAAISYSLGHATSEARREWERVARDGRLTDRAYEQALCCFNLGLVARKAGDEGQAQQKLARAQQLLEEVADDFETRGERERAFDCYAILLQLGREESSFENLAEGYTNCIRVLKEDNLKFYVLQYYEDFLRLALEREEFHAAAQVAREAADYARRLGLVYDRGYLKRSAETWWRAAEKNERDGGPVELSENAYLAAVDAFSALGDFFHVRESYERLAKIGLGDKKKERYSKVTSRYAGVAEEQVEAAVFPDYLRQQHAYPAIWELDLIEWELDGDYVAVCASIVGDRRYANMIRRKALHVVLLHLDAERLGGPQREDPQRLAAIAQGLGEVQAYPALRPLEKLYGHPHPLVRRGVMKALRNLYFKRTFLLVARGLRDEAKEVSDAAVEALESLRFPHAFDPLVRIFREHPDVRVKITALTSMGRIATLEAGEFLIEVLRYESEPLREAARRLLANFDNADIFPIVRRHLEVESGRTRADLQQVLRGAVGR